MVFFSVVVPVYNVEKYLNESIDSILNQDFKDFEIIIVDDGSTDSSPQLCDELKNKNGSIKVIHKSNGGLSDARNVGASNAEGDYIIFLDSDDYWNDVHLLKKLYDALIQSDPDIMIFGYKKVLDGNEISVYKPSSSSKTIETLVLAGEFNICAWDKVVRRELIRSNSISFRENVYSEDMEWCSLLYKYASKVDVLNELPYSYRQRSGSITKKISEKNIIDVMNNFEKCLQIKNDMSQEKGEVFEYYLAKNISMFMIALSRLNKKTREKYYTFVKRNVNYLRKSTRKREKMIYIVAKILGISVTELLLSIAYGVKRL